VKAIGYVSNRSPGSGTGELDDGGEFVASPRNARLNELPPGHWLASFHHAGVIVGGGIGERSLAEKANCRYFLKTIAGETPSGRSHLSPVGV